MKGAAIGISPRPRTLHPFCSHVFDSFSHSRGSYVSALSARTTVTNSCPTPEQDALQQLEWSSWGRGMPGAEGGLASSSSAPGAAVDPTQNTSPCYCAVLELTFLAPPSGFLPSSAPSGLPGDAHCPRCFPPRPFPPPFPSVFCLGMKTNKRKKKKPMCDSVSVSGLRFLFYIVCVLEGEIKKKGKYNN